MDYFQAVLLALIQGITEFLPISSSAHLILPSEILRWPDQGLAFDVAVHLGSLAAVTIYFRDDIFSVVRAWLLQFNHQPLTNDARLGWSIIIATIPAGLVGLLFNDFIEANLRSAAVIATTTIVFGLALWWADSRRHSKALSEMTVMLALLIGCAQALALIPGTSRSGITITAALFLGFSRVDAARFSFLLSVPVITLSGLLMTTKVLANGVHIDWLAVALGVIVSFACAYTCIHYFLKFITQISMLPFVLYRLALGALLFAYILSQ